MPNGCVRVILVARPEDDTPPKRYPDEDSLGAAWVTLEELDSLSLGGGKVRALFHYVDSEGPVYPLWSIAYEGAPFVWRSTWAACAPNSGCSRPRYRAANQRLYAHCS